MVEFVSSCDFGINIASRIWHSVAQVLGTSHATSEDPESSYSVARGYLRRASEAQVAWGQPTSNDNTSFLGTKPLLRKCKLKCLGLLLQMTTLKGLETNKQTNTVWWIPKAEAKNLRLLPILLTHVNLSFKMSRSSSLEK